VALLAVEVALEGVEGTPPPVRLRKKKRDLVKVKYEKTHKERLNPEVQVL
jgi:hypothetical protein